MAEEKGDFINLNSWALKSSGHRSEYKIREKTRRRKAEGKHPLATPHLGHFPLLEDINFDCNHRPGVRTIPAFSKMENILWCFIYIHTRPRGGFYILKLLWPLFLFWKVENRYNWPPQYCPCAHPPYLTPTIEEY